MTTDSQPDLIVTGGRIYTSDPDNEWAEALAVSGGRIAAVGTDAEVRALAGASTAVLDLEGRLALPGLVDV
ncbi:amidohydrolase, partial [Arthrobacter deserti]|nr:amidohydrolase [Arthrobacter deserti]